MYNQTKLSNGLKLITVPVTGTKTVTILVMFATGSKYETKQNNGISHFLEHMFFKGTQKRPNTLAISTELDRVGGEFNAFTAKEYTGYWVKVNKDKIELALDVVSDMLCHSKFDPEEIEREKGVIIEEINMYQDNPIYHIEDVFEQCLYGNTPAGWDVIGTKANIHRFDRKVFTDYFQSQYGAQEATLCIAGQVAPNAAKLAEKYFKEFKKTKSRPKDRVKEIQAKPGTLIHFKQTDQAHMSLGVRAYPYAHKNELIAKVVASILGGSMSSRLFIQLRERLGLAYYVRTNLEFYSDTGYLTAQVGVPVDKIETAIKVILKEYQILKTEKVVKEELQRVKDMLTGRLAIVLESSDNVANWYAKQATMLLTQAKDKHIKPAKVKVYDPEEYLRLLQKIKAEDIQRVAREIFTTSKLNLAVIGPYKSPIKFNNLLKI
jgi:predicted Zn-dependent peptidase